MTDGFLAAVSLVLMMAIVPPITEAICGYRGPRGYPDIAGARWYWQALWVGFAYLWLFVTAVLIGTAIFPHL